MTLNMQIFHHPKIKRPEITNRKQQQYIETTRLHLKRRPQPTRRNQSKVLKYHTDLSIHKRNSSVSSPATPGTGEK